MAREPKNYCTSNLDADSGDGLVMAADISKTPAFQAGTPRLLFRLTNARQTINSPGSITRDGQRFVFTMMNAPAGTQDKDS